jgi:hypothetical protein
LIVSVLEPFFLFALGLKPNFKPFSESAFDLQTQGSKYDLASIQMTIFAASAICPLCFSILQIRRKLNFLHHGIPDWWQWQWWWWQHCCHCHRLGMLYCW